MEIKNDSSAEINPRNISDPAPTLEKSIIESNNQNVLGLKRERATDESNKNSDIKKIKTEEFIQTQSDNIPSNPPIQQGNYIGQQYHAPNNYNLYNTTPNLINHHIAMQGVYGYNTQTPLYYYNPPPIPPTLPGKNESFYLILIFKYLYVSI